MTLTPAHIDQYQREGYAIGGAILSADALAQLQHEMDRAIAALPPGKRPENMPSLHYRNDHLRELFLSGALVDVAEQILGPDIALFTSYAISKRPHDGLPVAWHQDAAYFPIEPMETFTLWLAVDHSDSENACMQVVPGSHLAREVIPHVVDSSGTTTLELGLNAYAPNGVVDVPVSAGGYSVHDPFLIHGSGPNRSSRRRCGITIKYVPTYIEIDQSFVSPTGFDWANIRLYHARGRRGRLTYAN